MIVVFLLSDKYIPALISSYCDNTHSVLSYNTVKSFLCCILMYLGSYSLVKSELGLANKTHVYPQVANWTSLVMYPPVG